MEEHGYTVMRALGQGGCQSRVYEVCDGEGRLRVLKQLPWVGEADRTQALHEVHLLSSLRHPCIVSYLESFLVRSTPSMPAEDVLCLVMSCCERDLRQECLRRRLTWELEHEETLQEADAAKEARDSLAGHAAGATTVSAAGRSLPRGALFDEQQVRSWLAQLCWGLQHLHARKFLHRDLKPQNVLLTHGGRRALLADFGVAGKVDHTEDLRQSIVGTPAFMSPEMLEGRAYGIKTDQWALGCVLFEMMALEPPFAGVGESYAAVVNAVLHAREVRAPPGYSQELSACAEALLAKKPHMRPSNRELLGGQLLRAPFRAFVQSLGQAAAAAAAAGATNAACARLRAVPPPGGAGGPGEPDEGPLTACSAASMVSSVPTLAPTSAFVSARLPAAAAAVEAARDAMTPISTPSELGSPCPRRGFKASGSLGGTLRSGPGVSDSPEGAATVGIANGHWAQRLLVETEDVASYTSDFESDSWESPSHARGGQWDFVEEGGSGANGGGGASGARPSTAWVKKSESPVEASSLSVRNDLSLSGGGADLTATMGEGVGLGTSEWRQLLEEAESLIRGPAEADTAREASKVWEALCGHLGTPAQVDRALGFLRERRPLGETAEADELLLQVELGDLLGDEGLVTLPLLEHLLALEGAAPGGPLHEGHGTFQRPWSPQSLS